jgi:hypothetical protein
MTGAFFRLLEHWKKPDHALESERDYYQPPTLNCHQKPNCHIQIAIMNSHAPQLMATVVTANSRSRLKASANKVVLKVGDLPICPTSNNRGAPVMPNKMSPLPTTNGVNNISHIYKVNPYIRKIFFNSWYGISCVVIVSAIP